MRLLVSAWLLMALVPEAALAHSPSPGLQGAWRGALHVWSDPAQWPLLVAAGLWVGQQALPTIQKSLLAWLVSSFIGVAAAWAIGLSYTAPTELAVLALGGVTGLLAALAPHRFVGLGLLLSAIGGAALSILNMPEPGEIGAMIATLLGVLAALNLSMLMLAGGIDYAREQWPHDWLGIGWRVAAAWAATIGLLMLALRMAVPA